MGLFDSVRNAASNAYDTAAGVADDAAGNLDERFGRATGGGLSDSSDDVPDPSEINQDDEVDTSPPDSGPPTNPDPENRDRGAGGGSSRGIPSSDVPDPSEINQDDQVDTSPPDSGSPTNPDPENRSVDGGSSGPPDRSDDPNPFTPQDEGQVTQTDIVRSPDDSPPQRDRTQSETGIEQGSGQQAEQARDLEQQLVDQSTAARDASDVVVTQEGDQLRAQLTEDRQQSRAEFLQNEAETLAGIRASVAFEDSFEGQQRRGEDFTIEQQGDQFVATPTESFRRERAVSDLEQQLEDELGQDLERGEDFTVEQTDDGFSSNLTGSFQRDQAASDIESQFEERVGRDVSQDEFTLEQTNDGFRAVPTSDQLRQDLQEAQAPGRRDTDIFSGVVSGTEDALSEVAQVASGNESTRVEFQGEGSVVNVAAQETTDLTADLGPVSDFGDAATDVGGQINRKVIQPTAEVGGDVFAVIHGARQADVDRVTTAAGNIVEGPKQESSTVAGEQFGEGVTSGGLSIANIPALTGTAVDAGEVVVEAGSRTVQGEGGEFAQQAAGQAAVTGARTTTAAVENPARTTGQVVGGLVTSGGLIGGARKLGGTRAGRAASYAIQPGEELALTAARRGVPGATRVANAVGDVPVRSSGSGPDLTSPVTRSRERLSRATPDLLRELAADERGQLQLSGRGRRRGDSEEFPSEIVSTDPDVGEGSRLPDAPGAPSVEPTSATQPFTQGGSRARQRVSDLSPRRSGEMQTEFAPRPEGRTDTEFDPILGRERTKTEGQELQREAEQPQATVPESRFGVDEDLTPLLRAEVSAGVQETTTAAETGALDEVTGVMSETTTLEDTDLRVETAVEPATATETRTETRQETRTETGQETTTETRLETRTETRTEPRTELRLDTRQETNTDTERLREEEDLITGAVGGDVTKRLFEYGVASPEDVLSGDIGVAEESDTETLL